MTKFLLCIYVILPLVQFDCCRQRAYIFLSPDCFRQQGFSFCILLHDTFEILFLFSDISHLTVLGSGFIVFCIFCLA